MRCLAGARAPFVVRGLIADWPLVKAGLESGAAARAYLLDHRRDRAFTVNIGTPGAGDRLFYGEAMAMNFRTGRADLAGNLRAGSTPTRAAATRPPSISRRST